ncbi:MAG: glycosyltransferase family 4 protein [Spirochaetaceae bacterium]
MKKIGIFTRPIDQGTSGSGHYLKEIVKEIILENKDFDITFIHYQKNDKEIYKGQKELIIPRNPFKASKILKKHNFDLLHYSPLTIMAPRWGVKSKKVATIHGAEPDLIPQYYSKVKQLHSRLIMPIYARFMDHIFTVSETSKNYFVKQYKIDPLDISITYNAVNKAFKQLEGTSYPANKKFNTGDKFVFHISKCSHRKNPEGIIKAFKLFSNSYADYKLILAGSGWNSEYVTNLLKENSIEDKVIFPGFVAEQEVVELLNSATMFIFPSFAEGFGIPNVEAMSCGCPVITTGVFALPEVVQDAALIVEDPEDYKTIADKMKQIIEEPLVKEELIKKGLKRCQDFSWKDSSKHILNTYSELLK